ncbi:MlaA family lipoprotein [Candidatus Cyrtobacter comes]|uniref:MlaA family lipoprotein n=1 Tax=Candidatus Cyrtobacter comes TaxID=675776 RepID=UPI002ACDC105|nr:VacJ family lipoprotein [Candidatus Cyrtobacter comes]
MSNSKMATPHISASDESEFRFEGNDHPYSDIEIKDPLESFNRKMFKFNYVIDRLWIRPAAFAYKKYVPEFGKQRIDNFLDNLKQPLYAAQGIITLNPKVVVTATIRFILNSTLGVFGLFDFAATKKIKTPHISGTQILKNIGVKRGPYIVLPIFGPRFARETIGMVVDRGLDPLNFLVNRKATLSRASAKGLAIRSHILDITDQIEEDSIDKYAAIRYIYTHVHEKGR